MKIGITLDMSTAFWANGMQQNIVFLYSLLKQVPENDCYYITHKKPNFKLEKHHKGMLLDDIMSDESEKFDVLIIAGFDLLPDMYDELYKRNNNIKIILVHFGNKMMDDIHYTISPPKNGRLPIQKPKYLSQIWISPHHEFGKEYIKSYYDHEDVRVAPYIWDPYFVQEKVKELKNKDQSPFFDNNKIKSICVFEPNISHLKNCIIPIMILERFEKLHPNTLSSINIFNTDRIREEGYFFNLMKKLKIVQKKDFCYFNNRWSSLDALSKFGSTIVSHQIHNELNYSHLEALYLGLPLIHNSPRFENYGYYYPEFDIKMGANQLMAAIINHHLVQKDYQRAAREHILSYSPYNSKNIGEYNLYINDA